MILEFPTQKTPQDLYFINFMFYSLEPMEIVELGSSGPKAPKESSIGNNLSFNQVFDYDTRTEYLGDNIYLPLQSTVNETTSANYSETSLKNIGSISNLIEGVTSGDAGSFMEGLKQQATNRLPDELRKLATQVEGKAVNERMQVFYDGPNRRTYSFNFNLVARNIDDAIVMQRIAKRLQYHASPSLSESRAYWNYPNLVSFHFERLNYPETDEANFQNRGSAQLQTIESLYKSKKCFLQNVNIEYGDEKYIEFTNGSQSEPGIIKIELELQEVDYFYRDDFAE